MPQPDQLFQAFSARVRRLEATRRRVDSLLVAGRVSRQAADQIYESIFLSAFTAFEGFLEDVFLALLVAPHRGRSHARATPRVTVRSLPVARQLVIGAGRKYADWLPFDRTTERANLFFRGGRPFADVPAAERDVIKRAQLVRHLIAHRSRHSEERFLKEVIAGVPLPPRERRPGGYLRGLVTAVPAVTRHENYVATLSAVAKSLA